jgi:hypothetical protein
LNFLPIGISQFIVDDKISKIVALQGGSASTLYEKTLLLLLNNYEETKDESQLEMIVQLISEQNRGRDISAVPQWERDLLVLSYELLYPEKQSVMDAFLDPLIHHSDITLIEHVQNIKYLSYASPQPYHDALFEHLPKMSIEDINFTEPDLSAPGSHRPAAQYDPNNGKIYFNLAADSISDRGSYSALFHEVGHGVDIEMGMSSTALNDTVRNDVAAAIRAEIESHYPSPLSADDAFAINTIRESLMPGGYPLHDPDLIDIRNRVRHNFSNGALAAGDNDVASDVYGGVTGNVIRGSHVHSPEYWNIHQPSLEFFAGAFSRNITQHTNPLSSVNNNFPNASREFENLFN